MLAIFKGSNPLHYIIHTIGWCRGSLRIAVVVALECGKLIRAKADEKVSIKTSVDEVLAQVSSD
jgi:hypothetical protein